MACCSLNLASHPELTMRSVHILKNWVTKLRHGRDAPEPEYTGIVPGGLPACDLMSHVAHTAPTGPSSKHWLDGAWCKVHQGTNSPLPDDMSSFIIRGNLLVTACSTKCLSEHRSRTGALRCKDWFLELDSDHVLRVVCKSGHCIFYQRMQLPSESVLRNLQGCWSSSSLASQKKHAITIKGPFWQTGTSRGIVYMRPRDGAVIIQNDASSITSHDQVKLGRKTFSRQFQPSLWVISEA